MDSASTGIPAQQGSITPTSEQPGVAQRFGVALLCVVASLLVRGALAPALGAATPYITFFPGIMVSAWYGGLGPGLVTTALSAISTAFLVLGPLRITEKTELLGFFLFLAVGAVISWLNEALHRARWRVEAALAAHRDSESALRESEERYRVMAEAASDGIITIDDQSVIRYVNTSAARIFGYACADLLGQQLTVLMPQYLRHVHKASLQRYVETGTKHLNWQAVELPGLHKTGATLALEVSFGESTQGGQQLFTGSVRDVTQRKRFDEQLKHSARLESLGVLAGGVAHDFNNLLTGIMGNASLAWDTLPPENPARQMVRDVVAASERAAHLTRQLLAYAGKGQFIIAPLNLARLVREISALVRTSIPKTVQLRFDLQEDLPLVAGDASQLQQVVMNLVINGAEAIPAGDSGSVLVRTGVQEVDESYIRSTVLPGDLAVGQYVLLEVHDTGRGMDAATRERMFDPFFTTKFTGRGLGLAAVQGIVRGHKGALKVYSTPGQGTTIKVLFPVTTESAVTPPVPDIAAVEQRPSGVILVVDDEEIVRNTAKAALEQHGYAALFANSGADAVALYRERGQEIALVVLDLTMPGISGDETLRQLKLLQPGIKVILSSGYNEVEVVHRFVGKGLAGFLQKPYTAAALINTVARALMWSN